MNGNPFDHILGFFRTEGMLHQMHFLRSQLLSYEDRIKNLGLLSLGKIRLLIAAFQYLEGLQESFYKCM